MTLQGDWLAGELNVGYPESSFGTDSGVRELFPGIVQRFEVNETTNKNTFWGFGRNSLDAGPRAGPKGFSNTKYEVNGRIEWLWCQDTYDNSPFLWLFFQDPGTGTGYTIYPSDTLPKFLDLEMMYDSTLYRYLTGVVVDSMTINVRENEIVTGELSFLAKSFSNSASGYALKTGTYGTPIVPQFGNVTLTTGDSAIDRYIIPDFKMTFKNNVRMHYDVKSSDKYPSAATAEKFEAQIDISFLVEEDYIRSKIEDTVFSSIEVHIGQTTIRFKNAQITSPFPIKISSDMGVRKETYTFVPELVEVVFNA